MDTHRAFQCNSGEFGAMVAPVAHISTEVIQMATRAQRKDRAERREERRTEREARQLVWDRTMAAVQASPNATADEIKAQVASELVGDAPEQGFEISTIIELITVLLPLILKLFGR